MASLWTSASQGRAPLFEIGSPAAAAGRKTTEVHIDDDDIARQVRNKFASEAEPR